MVSSENVGHLVDDALLLFDDPLGGHDGSTDEDLPGVGLVADLDSLGVTDEHNCVVTDDVSTTDGVDSDLLSTRTDSLTSIDEFLSSKLLAVNSRKGLYS